MAKMTRRQFERLSREIDEIEKVKLPEAKQRERKCREAGDLSENEAFDAAKREVEDLKSSLEEKRKDKASATIIEINYTADDTINIGSRVKFKLDNSIVLEKIFDSEKRGDFEETVSDNSPAGRAIFGKRNGDIVSYNDANGDAHTIEILRVL